MFAVTVPLYQFFKHCPKDPTLLGHIYLNSTRIVEISPHGDISDLQWKIQILK